MNITLKIFILLVLGTLQSRADQTIYSNGAIDGNSGAYAIGGGPGVSDSFTITNTTTLDSVSQIGIWTNTDAAPVSAQWSIGTNAFGTQEGFGSALFTNSLFLPANSQGFAVWSSSFSLNLTLDPGTYFLSLVSAGTSTGTQSYWDMNNGPSIAYVVPPYPPATANSESFQLNGTESVPDAASTLPLLGGALAGLTALRRRFVK